MPRLLILPMLVFAATAIARSGEAWHFATRAADGTTVLLRTPTGNVKEHVVWVKLDYSTKTLTPDDQRKREAQQQLAERGLLACGGNIRTTCVPGEDEPHETIQQWALRCQDRTISIRSTTVYDARGHVIDSGSGPTKFTEVVPDSIAEEVLAIVCRKGERG